MQKAPVMTMVTAPPATHEATVQPVTGAVRLLPHTSLSDADISAWHALGAQARSDAGANVFAQPWVVEAGLRHCADTPVTLAFVCEGGGQLIGVAPLVMASRLGRFPLRHWQIWNHPNSFCAPVLIRAGQEQRFWDVLLAHLARGPDVSALAMAECPLDSAILAGLDGTARERGLGLAIVEQHARALASGAEPLDSYWDTHVRAKKRKELRRQATRLAELGTLQAAELAQGESPAPWLDEFLALERLGWKGAAGSALAAAPGTEAYFRTVVTAAHDRGALSFLALRLDGRAIAMLVTLFDGAAAFSFKTAYDESLARFSPGVQVQRENLTMLATRKLCWADSCAAADHPMIDSIWAQRRAIGTVVVALPGIRNRLIFNAYRAALTGWRWAKRANLMVKHRA